MSNRFFCRNLLLLYQAQDIVHQNNFSCLVFSFLLKILQDFVFPIIVLSIFYSFRKTFNFLLFLNEITKIFIRLYLSLHISTWVYFLLHFRTIITCLFHVNFLSIALDYPLHRPTIDRAFPTFLPCKCPYHALLLFRSITDQMVHLISKCPL